MKYLILFLMFSQAALACTNDFQCGYGKFCVKPEGSYKLEGTCVTKVDDYGNKDYSADSSWGSGTVQEVDACSWDTDCGVGFKCKKKSGDLQGLCVKR